MPSTTFTYSAANGQRLLHAVGVALQLKDAQDQPRDATAQEAKNWLWGRARQLVIDIEGREMEQARGPVVVPDMDAT